MHSTDDAELGRGSFCSSIFETGSASTGIADSLILALLLVRARGIRVMLLVKAMTRTAAGPVLGQPDLPDLQARSYSVTNTDPNFDDRQ